MGTPCLPIRDTWTYPARPKAGLPASTTGTGGAASRNRARARQARSGHRPRYDIFTLWIEPGSSVLDIGCGDGAFGEHIVAARAARYLGVDLSESGLELARARGLEVRQVDLGASAGALDELRFDYVVLSEVIEHVVDSEELLELAGRIAGRRVLLSVPNIAYWQYRLQLLRGRFPRQWAQDPREHLRFWSVPDFTRMAEELGFRVETVAASNGRRGLRDLWPNLFGVQVCFLLEPPRH